MSQNRRPVTDFNLPNPPVSVFNGNGRANLVLICEHASNFVPAEFGDLGLSEAQLTSHIAWDPGAVALAHRLSELFDAPLVAGTVSRLIYDCNRPPTAPDAFPELSEIHTIPGNENLSNDEKSVRTNLIYQPFTDALTGVIVKLSDPVIITIHSFTPTYRGVVRAVELGILHDTDRRLADAVLNFASQHSTLNVQRNTPYGPEDGVTHTLKTQAVKHGHMNVMIEVQNQHLTTPNAQDTVAKSLNNMVRDGLKSLSRDDVFGGRDA